MRNLTRHLAEINDAASAMLVEELLKDVIPFLAMDIHWLTVCDNSTQCKIDNAWCYECSELRDGHKRSETCEVCPECKNLKSIIQLSRHWNEVMWKQRCAQRRRECELVERRRIREMLDRPHRYCYTAEYMQQNFWRTNGELLTIESQARSRT